MFSYSEMADSLFESFNFTKTKEEQSQDIQRNSNLPYYMRVLLKKRDEIYVEYINTNARAKLITYYKLNEICKKEIASFEESGTIVRPNSPIEILEGLQKELILSEVWFRITNVKIFWDIHVGLFEVKEIIYGIRDVKTAEYNMLMVIS